MAIVRMEFFSNALYRNVQFTAILPVDPRCVSGDLVSSKPIKPLRTLYLLHGLYDNHENWLTNSRIRLFAEEHQIAVIMPSGENKFYNDNNKVGDRFGLYIGRELVEFSRQIFPLSDKREDTYIGGLSMGGYGATVTALRYPETFSKGILLSSAYVFEDYPEGEGCEGVQGSRNYYISVGGTPEERKGGNDDYYALATKVANSGIEKPEFFMACGYQDDLLEYNRKYHHHLVSLGYQVEYLEEDGRHDWYFWDRNINRAIKWLG